MDDPKSGEDRYSKEISRSDVRKATIEALKRTKQNPHSLRITEGQRRHITERFVSKSAANGRFVSKSSRGRSATA